MALVLLLSLFTLALALLAAAPGAEAAPWLAAGGSHACVAIGGAAPPIGGVHCWGSGSSGVTGRGSSDDVGSGTGLALSLLSPLTLPLATDLAAVAAGRRHTCALVAAAVLCWGDGGAGRLGSGATADLGDESGEMGVLPSVHLPLAAGQPLQLALGEEHSCARFASGVLCWGEGGEGRLGTGAVANVGDAPDQMSDLDLIALSGSPPTVLAAGSAHNCVIIPPGAVRCWGSGGNGRLGTGGTSNVGSSAGQMSSINDIVFSTAALATHVTCGDAFTCVAFDDSSVRCWGFNAYGQLGTGDTASFGDSGGTAVMSMLAAIPFSATAPVAAIDAAHSHVCAIIGTGVRCWGRNDDGRLGIGNTDHVGDQGGEMASVPTIVFNSGASCESPPVELAVGGGHVPDTAFACALFANSGVVCWGNGENGRLGTDATADAGPTDAPVIFPDHVVNVELTGGPVVVAEGQTAQFQLALSSPPAESVQVTLSGGSDVAVSETITFSTACWNSPLSFVVQGITNDIDDGAQLEREGIISFSLASSDARFDSVLVCPIAASMTDKDTAGFQLSPTTSQTLSESSGTAMFFLSINSRPTQDVVFQLATSAPARASVSPDQVTFSDNGSWYSPVAIVVEGIDNGDSDGDATSDLSISILSTTDAVYGALGLPVPIEITVVDDEGAAAEILVSLSSTSVGEGEELVVSVSLASEPTGTAVLTPSFPPGATLATSQTLSFSAGNFGVGQPLTLTAGNDDWDLGYNHVVTVTLDASPEYASVSWSQAITILEDDTAGVVASGPSSVDEGGTWQGFVRLTSRPFDPVTLAVTSAVPSVLVSADPIVFNPNTMPWNVDVPFSLVVANDSIDFETDPVVSFTVTATPSDAGYDNEFAATTSVFDIAIVDNDVRGINGPSPASLFVAEGGEATITFVLETEPQFATSIQCISALPSVATVLPEWLTFLPADYAAPLTFTVSAVENNDELAGNAAQVGLNFVVESSDSLYDVLDVPMMSVFVVDNDQAAGIRLPDPLSHVDEGGSDTFSVRLGSEPTHAVTLELADDALGDFVMDPAAINFAPIDWFLARTVTLSALDNNIAQGPSFVRIVDLVAESDDGDYTWSVDASIGLGPVTVADNDLAAFAGFPFADRSLDEGQTSTFALSIASAPTVPVTLSPQDTSDASRVSFVPPVLTFDPVDFETAKTMTVSAVSDFVVSAETTTMVTFSLGASSDAPWFNNQVIDGPLLTIRDLDTANVTVSTEALAITEAATATYTIVLATRDTVRVDIVPSSPLLLDVNPGQVQFTPANFDRPATVTVTAVDNLLAGAAAASLSHTVVASEASPYNGFSLEPVQIDIDDPTDLLPAVATVEPAYGPVAGGFRVTLTGAALVVNGTLAAVTVGENGLANCTDVAVVNVATLTCLMSPASAPGPAAVRVATPAGASRGPDFVFSPPAAVLDVEPRAALAREHARINITLNTPDASVAAEDVVIVHLAGIPCTDVTQTRPFVLSCTAGAAPSAVNGPVTVSTLGRGPFRANVTFSFSVPTISAVSPAQVPSSGGNVTVFGTDLDSTSAVDIGSESCLDLSVLTATSVACTVPPMRLVNASLVGKTVDVRLATRLGGSAVAMGVVELFVAPVIPVIDDFSPHEARFGSGRTTLSVFGSEFGPPNGDIVSVSAAGRSCNDVHVVSPNLINCTLEETDEATSGPVRVLSTDALVRSAESFVFLVLDAPGVEPRPVVFALQPERGSFLGGTVLTITGRYLGRNARDVTAIRVAGIACRTSSTSTYVSSTRLVCQTSASSLGGRIGPVVVETASGGTGSEASTGAVFTYEYPAPIVDDVFPRVALPAGGPRRVTLVGAHFGLDATVSRAVVLEHGDGAVLGNCTDPEWLSPTRMACRLPSARQGTRANVVLAVGPASHASNASVFFTSPVCEPTCGEHGDCDLDASPPVCLCHNGYVGAPACDRVALSVQVTASEQRDDGVYFLSEDGTRSATVAVRLDLVPKSTVVVPIAVSDPLELSVDRNELTFVPSNFGRQQTLRVTGVDDGLRDGTSESLLVFGPSRSDDPIFSSSLHVRIPFATLDRLPVIASIEPIVSPLNGTNMTISGRHFDTFAQVLVGNVAASVTAYVTSDGGVRRRRDDASFVADSDTVAPDNVVQLIVELPRLGDGYHAVRVVNGERGETVLADRLFYTDDCPFEGQFGRGADCVDCPEGAVCPGGYRMWAQPGFWTPSETAGFVAECDPAEACVGTVAQQGSGSGCAAGYEGDFCSACADKFYEKGGACSACPQAESFALALGCDVFVWLIVAVAGVLMQDRENFGHVISFVLLVQTVGGVGRLITHQMPTWLLSLYELFHLFSGDISFLKPDCQGRVDYSLDFAISLAYNVAIIVPLFAGLGSMYALVRLRQRSADDADDKVFERKERREFYVNRAIRAATVWLTIIYYSVTTRVFGAFACTRTAAGDLRLVVDRTVVCFGEEHMPVFLVSSVLFVAVTLAWPVWYHVKTARNAKTRLYEDLRFANRWDFLTDPFKKRFRIGFWAEFLISIVMALGDTVMQDSHLAQLVSVGGLFFILVLLLLLLKPMRRAYENFVFAAVFAANVAAMLALFLSEEGVLEPESLAEKGLVLAVAFLVGVALFALILVLVVSVYWATVAEDMRADMVLFLAHEHQQEKDTAALDAVIAGDFWENVDDKLFDDDAFCGWNESATFESATWPSFDDDHNTK